MQEEWNNGMVEECKKKTEYSRQNSGVRIQKAEHRTPQLNRFHIQRGRQKSEDSRRATAEEGKR